MKSAAEKEHLFNLVANRFKGGCAFQKTLNLELALSLRDRFVDFLGQTPFLNCISLYTRNWAQERTLRIPIQTT